MIDHLLRLPGWMGDGAERSNFDSSGDQPPSRNPPRVLVRTKDTPLTQDILRDLGTLCQELEAETKYIFLMMSHSPAHSLVRIIANI